MFSREKVRIISLTISGSSQRGDFTSWTSEGGSAHFHEVKQAASGSTLSVCTGRATSCSNTLRRQIASCVLHDFCRKSVSTIALCSCNKSQKIKSDNLCDFLRRQNSVAETDFYKNSPVHTKRFIAATYGMPFVSKQFLPHINLYIKCIKHFAL